MADTVFSGSNMDDIITTADEDIIDAGNGFIDPGRAPSGHAGGRDGRAIWLLSASEAR